MEDRDRLAHLPLVASGMLAAAGAMVELAQLVRHAGYAECFERSASSVVIVPSAKIA